jgi:hypothetical protein
MCAADYLILCAAVRCNLPESSALDTLKTAAKTKIKNISQHLYFT